jgi:hypothetical protein
VGRQQDLRAIRLVELSALLTFVAAVLVWEP